MEEDKDIMGNIKYVQDAFTCVVDENFHESTVYEIYKFILKNW